MHWAIIDLYASTLTAPAVEPGDGVLHPILVVALGEILMHVRAAAFLAVGGAMHGDHRLAEQIVELKRLDEVAVPDEAAVGDVDVGHLLVDRINLRHALGQGPLGP